MGKKKPFIDKKKASTYHLVHRSQRDIGEDVLFEEGDVTGAGMILWPSPNNNKTTDANVLLGGEQNATKMSEWRNKLAAVGLLHDDPNRFLKPISGTGTFLDASGRVGSAGVVDPCGESEAVDDALIEVNRQFDSIPLTTEFMDEDVAAALNGDFEEGEFEELNDDFVLNAATEPEEASSDAFDFDQHIEHLIKKAKLERNGPVSDYSRHDQGRQDQAFFAGLRPVHEKDEDDDSFANVASVEDGTMATLPGVFSALNPAEERALCEKFEEALLEYDSDDFGECPEEEVHGTRQLEGDEYLESALDEFLQQKDDEILISGVRNSRQGGSSYAALMGTKMVPANELGEYEIEPVDPVEKTLRDADERLAAPHEKPPTDEILIDGKSYFSEREMNPFDCESILSTYSNLDNNPTTIGASRRRRRSNHRTMAPEEPGQFIELSKKTGLPLGVLPTRLRDEEDDDDNGDTYMSVNKGVARKKSETKEEKKARKVNVKMERQMARIQKKVAREIFAEEFEKHNLDIATNDIAGKTVFRYS